jgi:hypothetical protein
MWPWILKVTGHKKNPVYKGFGYGPFGCSVSGMRVCLKNLMCIIIVCVRIEISCLATDFKSQHLGFHQPF